MTKRIDDSTAAARARADQARRAAKTLSDGVKKAPKGLENFKRNDEFSTGKGKALRVKALSIGNALIADVRPSAPSAVASPAQRAAADAQRIAAQAKTDPEGASRELKKAMKDPDPAYHAALVAKSEPAMTAIAQGLQKAKPAVIEATVGNIAEISQAAGPAGGKALGTAFAKGLDGGIGGFTSVGDAKVPKGPGSAAFFKAMMTMPGMGDFVSGMLEGAKATKNLPLLRDMSDLIGFSARSANSSFEKAQQKVDQLNSELNALVQGFGPGDAAKLQKAVQAFKDLHQAEYAALETAGAAMTNVLTLAGPLLATGKLDVGMASTLLKSLSLAPQVLATSAGQGALGRALDAQAHGEASPMLDLILEACEGKDGDALREQVGPAVMQAYGTRIAALKAEGRDADARALINSMGKNAALFGVKNPKDLKEVQSALNDALDGKPGAIDELNLAIGSIGPFLKEGSNAAAGLKGLGFVVGVAGLGKSFEGFSDAQVQDKVGTIASTLGLGNDGASLAVRVFGSPEAQAGLEKLFGKVSTVTGVIGAVVGVIDFAQTAENGSIGDVAVSGLNAASGVLLLIPGGQVAGVGLALASFALHQVLGERRQQEAEHASEADAKAFLIAAGLSEDFAKVFSNLDNDKQNIGAFVDQVAHELGLTRDQLFDKLNHATGKDREKLLKTFGGISAMAEISEQFDGGKLPIFGPPLTLKDLDGLPDFISKKDRQKIVDQVNAQREKLAGQIADTIEPLLD